MREYNNYKIAVMETDEFFDKANNVFKDPMVGLGMAILSVPETVDITLIFNRETFEYEFIIKGGDSIGISEVIYKYSPACYLAIGAEKHNFGPHVISFSRPCNHLNQVFGENILYSERKTAYQQHINKG